MTQHVLMILPSTEDESTRLVGPFLAEHLAHRWADSRGIDPARRMVRPLEQPKSVYGQGRHALVPSPHPRSDSKPPRFTITGDDQGGGIRHWVTGEALELAPWNVMGKAEAVANWSGPIARFNYPTTDGRVLELNGPGAGDWISHFTRVPVGVWVIAPNVGALPIGLCERVRVKDGWLMGEGRISFEHFQKAAPELFAEVVPSWETGVYTVEMEEKPIPAAIDVTNGRRDLYPQGVHVTGPWELERVVFGTVPAWPGCSVRLGDHAWLETKR